MTCRALSFLSLVIRSYVDNTKLFISFATDEQNYSLSLIVQNLNRYGKGVVLIDYRLILKRQSDDFGTRQLAD